jgi:hypothetical protein
MYVYLIQMFPLNTTLRKKSALELLILYIDFFFRVIYYHD